MDKEEAERYKEEALTLRKKGEHKKAAKSFVRAALSYPMQTGDAINPRTFLSAFLSDGDTYGRKSLECFSLAGEEYEKAGKLEDAKKYYSLAGDTKKVTLVSGRIGERGQGRRGLFNRLFNSTRGITSVIAIAGLLGGIFFLSTNITGNAIADLSTKTTSFLGAGLLIVGLVAGFFWVKSRKK